LEVEHFPICDVLLQWHILVLLSTCIACMFPWWFLGCISSKAVKRQW